MIVLNHPQGSAEWLRARAGVCTASRFADARDRVNLLTDQQAKYVAALREGRTEAEAMALASYKAKPRASAIDRALAGEPMRELSAAAKKYAWLIACETVAGEPLDDTFVTYAMQRGRDLEPEARMAYEMRTGALVEEASLILTDDRLFGYSTDGLIGTDGLVEIKCPMSCDLLGDIWANPDTAHLPYLDQMLGGLWITGRQFCDLVVFCPWLKSVGKDLFVKRIHRDDGAIEAMETDLIEFRRQVDRNLAVLRAPAASPRAAPEALREERSPQSIAPWADAASTPFALPESIF